MSRAKSIGTLMVVMTFSLLLLAFIIVPALAAQLAKQPGNAPVWLDDLLETTESIGWWSMFLFLVVWVFALGSTFASFLNVVAWRVPQGRTILGSSHCPACDQKLSFKDNIPVIGWLRNGGQCSSCQSPISIRYLLVEIALGLIFLFIAALVIVAGGATLPQLPESSEHWAAGGLGLEFQLLQFTVFYWLLTLVLFAFCLIELENSAIPISVWGWSAVFGLSLMTAWPNLLLVDWMFPFDNGEHNRWLALGVYSASGLACGTVFGKILDWSGYLPGQPNSFVIGNSLVGMFLGWQSTIAVACITSVALLVSGKFRFENQTFTNLVRSPHGNLLLGVLIHLSTWRWFNLI